MHCVLPLSVTACASITVTTGAVHEAVVYCLLLLPAVTAVLGTDAVRLIFIGVARRPIARCCAVHAHGLCTVACSRVCRFATLAEPDNCFLLRA
jgi:hypothetical protein